MPVLVQVDYDPFEPRNPFVKSLEPPKKFGQGWAPPASPLGGMIGLTQAQSLLPMLENVLSAPKEAWEGKLSQDEMIQRAGEMATTFGLGGLGMAEPQAAGIFGGQLAKKFPKGTLSPEQVKGISDLGVRLTPEETFAQTGWFRGADKKPRFEFDDSKARLNALKPGKPVARLENALVHPELFEAYPDLRGKTYFEDPQLKNSPYYGYSQGDLIAMNPDLSPEKKLSTLLHETQHQVQDLENFAKGGVPPPWEIPQHLEDEMQQMLEEKVKLSKKPMSQRTQEEYNRLLAITDREARFENVQRMLVHKAYQEYKNLMGETEARNVQARQGLSLAQRKQQAPWLTEDTPRASQTTLVPVEFDPFAGEP